MGKKKKVPFTTLLCADFSLRTDILYCSFNIFYFYSNLEFFFSFLSLFLEVLIFNAYAIACEFTFINV